MTTIVKATDNTYLKTEPKDSSLLKESEKVLITKDIQLTLVDLKPLNANHYKVELTEPIEKYPSVNGYIYAPHWQIISTNKSKAVLRQIERLQNYAPNLTLNFNTKTTYFSQRDNYTMPHRTCNSSSNAMYLDWLLKMIGKPGLKTDDEYLQKVLKNGDTIYHEVHTKTIKEYGFATKWMTDADLKFVDDLLIAGFPVVANILHRGNESAPRGGHIILLIGKNTSNYIAHDPYGTLDSQYQNTKGMSSIISVMSFVHRWQGGYRILA